jgi:hypothetical protein
MRSSNGCLIVIALVAILGVLTAATTPLPGEAQPTTIELRGRTPATIALRERFTMTFDVTNVGDRDIGDLGIKINRGYIGGMVVVGTEPRANFDDDAATKRFYFGPLKRGETGYYRISLIPTRPGEFNAAVTFTDGRSLGGPLDLMMPSGPAEWKATTVVRE